MNNIKFKRICAYFIDLLIISLLVTLVSKINFLNPNRSKYEKLSLELYNYTMELTENISNMQSMDTSKLITDKYVKYFYNIEYLGISYTIMESIIILLYFTFFPKFNNSQTIGMQLWHLKIVNTKENKDVNIKNYSLRGLYMPMVTNVIFRNVILSLMNVVLLFIFKGKIYFYTNMMLTFIVCIMCYIDIIKLLISKDNNALHDKMTKTKVVEIC